uniref:SRCR domain-containing protein n=1 Tax=Macrostomum lignano TaxID=282301 RepID=A0A1I8F959_9PLAT
VMASSVKKFLSATLFEYETQKRFLRHTNVVITKNQSQTTCEEDKDNKWHAKCSSDSDCIKGHVHGLGWGVRTGRCLNSTREEGLRICEIYGWCPTEQDVLPLGRA